MSLSIICGEIAEEVGQCYQSYCQVSTLYSSLLFGAVKLPRSKVERVRGDRAVIADTTNLGILLLGGCLAALSMASCGSRH